MTIKKIDKVPEDWPKAPGRSYWAQDERDYCLIVGTRTVGKVLRETGPKPYRVWALTSLESNADCDCTAAFKTFSEAMDALVEHVEEYGTHEPMPAPKKDPDLMGAAELVRDIRVRATAIGTLALVSSVMSVTAHFAPHPFWLGGASSVALGAAIMAFIWRVEAGAKDG
jgi:hypothetical protein